MADEVIDLVPAIYVGGDMQLRPLDGTLLYPGDEVHVIPELVDQPGSPYASKVTREEGARLKKLARNLAAGMAGQPLED